MFDFVFLFEGGVAGAVGGLGAWNGVLLYFVYCEKVSMEQERSVPLRVNKSVYDADETGKYQSSSRETLVRPEITDRCRVFCDKHILSQHYILHHCLFGKRASLLPFSVVLSYSCKISLFPVITIS